MEHRTESAAPAQAEVLPTLIDNRQGNTLLEAAKRLMPAAQSVDIATGYFEVGALVALDGAWRDVGGGIRLLMGDEMTRATKAAILEGLSDSRRNGIEQAKVEDDWGAVDHLQAIRNAIATGKILPKVYTRAKFHAKSMHYKTGGVVNHGIIGSSNFTRRGMTENIELNLFTSDNSQLRDLEAWFERAWAEAEDIRPDLLKIIEPHVREYSPFEVYLRAMRERFFGLEPGEITWEREESRIYPILAQYQRDAYHDLMRHAKEWGGGLLCDGVGLGKTHVALMLIERRGARRRRCSSSRQRQRYHLFGSGCSQNTSRMTSATTPMTSSSAHTPTSSATRGSPMRRLACLESDTMWLSWMRPTTSGCHTATEVDA